MLGASGKTSVAAAGYKGRWRRVSWRGAPRIESLAISGTSTATGKHAQTAAGVTGSSSTPSSGSLAQASVSPLVRIPGPASTRPAPPRLHLPPDCAFPTRAHPSQNGSQMTIIIPILILTAASPAKFPHDSVFGMDALHTLRLSPPPLATILFHPAVSGRLRPTACSLSARFGPLRTASSAFPPSSASVTYLTCMHTCRTMECRRPCSHLISCALHALSAPKRPCHMFSPHPCPA